MRWLIRTSAALVAAYALALQALLSGFAPAVHFGFDRFAVVCAADGSGDHEPSVPQHRSDCDACLAVCCNGAPALVPTSVAFSPVLFTERPQRLLLALEAPSLQLRHQPQESRAPPLVS
jgi:hypothetical protein